jgi:hypothetical protein
MQKANNFRRVAAVAVALLGLASGASATENGGSVWPLGAESYATAAGVPRAGETMFLEYTCFVNANQLVDGHGRTLPTNFSVKAFVVAGELSHNWGVKVFGGEWESHFASPSVDQSVRVGSNASSDQGFSNINLVPFDVLNHKGFVHWNYELEFQTLATGYRAGSTSNIGEHNTAMTPGAAITLTPHAGAQNINSGFNYIVNNVDHATHYHSGNEFLWQFDGQQRIGHRGASIGLQGFYFKQITNDTHNGATVVTTNVDGSQSIGNKGRQMDLGPQVTFPWGRHGALVFKWNHDMLVENRARGNSFWFQFGVPLSYLHHPVRQ